MKNLFLLLACISLWMGCTAQKSDPDPEAVKKSIYDFSMTDINGEEVPLSNFEGKPILIVNVASKCGLTPQYESLQAFYDTYKDQGLVILGFPANDFMGQEPGSEEEIQTFCKKNYGVSFPMFSKISVKGKDQHPLYAYLTKATGQKVSWNFHKYLIGKDGKVIRDFSPRTTVEEQEVIDAVEELL